MDPGFRHAELGKEEVVAKVMIVCPTTGKYVSVGIEMDRGSFASSRMENNSMRCGACGETHRWSSSDARLIEEIPAP